MNFDMYTPAGNTIVFRIAEAARMLKTKDCASEGEVMGFVHANLIRINEQFPESLDTIVEQNVLEYVERG